MNVVKYLSEVRSELSKVSWPKTSEVVKLTLIVLLISGVFGIFLGLVDFGFTKMLEELLTT